MTTYSPPMDLKQVLEEEIKEWHFHIYFLQNNEKLRTDALALRDAILRLRRDGAFVAVPLWRVNYGPIGPHPVGSYEVWCPAESFASMYSYMCQYRGDLSIFIHPLTREQRKDHGYRNSWLGPSFALDLSTLPVLSDAIPFQYDKLKMGYNSDQTPPTIDQRKETAKKVEAILADDPEAAEPPAD